MNRLRLCIIPLSLVALACDRGSLAPADGTESLAKARRGFKTRLVRQEADPQLPPTPATKRLRLVQYDAPVGKLAAYVSRPARKGERHPAIIWIFGGFDNGIGETAWEDAPAEDDQSASVFWKKGVVTMYPSFRGGSGNPGHKEAFYGEVDDVLAAADYLAAQDFVDPNRIYLGGHSTGATLALLAAEMSGERFRAVFCSGPVENVGGYGAENLPFDVTSRRELELRAPILWLDSIKRPVFVFEGADGGNMDALGAMEEVNRNPLVRFHAVPGADHFSLLRPLTRALAEKVLGDTGTQSNLAFTPDEVSGLLSR